MSDDAAKHYKLQIHEANLHVRIIMRPIKIAMLFLKETERILFGIKCLDWSRVL